jgi:FkbM family methyltransferase
MSKTYYSQHGQDKFLEEFVFKGYSNGIFVDVGANDGISINNTLFFEKNNNWTGLNIEPMKLEFDTLVKERPKCINLNCAVSDFNGTDDFLLISGYSSMISGLKNEYDDRHLYRLLYEIEKYGGEGVVITVETRTLESIFDEYKLTTINFLSIDVEGAEFKVIKSINFNKVFIDVICFENNYQDLSVNIIEYLISKGYFLLSSNDASDILMLHKESVFSSPLKK